MAEFSFPQLAARSVSARILDAVRRSKMEIVAMGDTTPSSAGQLHPTVPVAKARDLIAQARSKSVPSGWRHFLRNIRRLAMLALRIQESQSEHLKQLAILEQRLQENQGEQLKELALSKQRLLEMLGRQQKEFSILQRALAEIESALPAQISGFNKLYLRLGEIFRESEELVQKRLLIYLPYVQNAGTGGGVLDLGCGGGEWLALLREDGQRAQGVDINGALVARCSSRGLDVRQEDLFEYLRKQKDSSFAVVTAFHVAECLSFDQLVELLDQSLRVLVPGGVAIFETPNPGNVLVSSNSSYLDPTHSKPLPPKLFKFLLKSRGFASSEILALHPMPESARVRSKWAPGLARAFNEFFSCPQDYAALGWKPSR